VVNVANVAQDKRFYGSIDTKTGFKTTNILGAPIKTLSGVTIGVVELVNKTGDDSSRGFSEADQTLLVDCLPKIAYSLMQRDVDSLDLHNLSHIILPSIFDDSPADSSKHKKVSTDLALLTERMKQLPLAPVVPTPFVQKNCSPVAGTREYRAPVQKTLSTLRRASVRAQTKFLSKTAVGEWSRCSADQQSLRRQRARTQIARVVQKAWAARQARKRAGAQHASSVITRAFRAVRNGERHVRFVELRLYKSAACIQKNIKFKFKFL
jgi:hypothetical protein